MSDSLVFHHSHWGKIVGGASHLSLTGALRTPDVVAGHIRSATPQQLPLLLEVIAREDPSQVEADQRTLAQALRREAEALRRAESIESLERARDRLLALLQPTTNSSAEIGVDRFAPTGEVVARLQVALALAESPLEAARRDYRPETLHVSLGKQLPIRPGLSQTHLLRASSPPRVLFVSLFPLGSNGSGTYTRAMAEYIIAQGGEARVLFPGHDFYNSGFPAIQYVMPFTPPSGATLSGAARANMPVLHANPASPNGFRFADLTPLQLSAFTEGLADAVVEAAEDMNADVLVVNHAWVGAEAARRTGLPFVVVGHGTCSLSMEEALQSGSGYPKNLSDFVLPGVRQADRVIAVTPEVGKDIARIYNVPSDHIGVIPHGFDDKVFYPRPDLSREAVLASFGIKTDGMTHLVTFAGRIVGYRGLHILFRAIPSILEATPGVHFVVAGDGAEREKYQRIAQRLGITSNVHFVGHLSDRNRLAELLAISDLVVNPTFTESFGLGTLEAAGVGTPVVASAVGGLRTLVTDEVGVLVPPGDSNALGKAILQALFTDLKGRLGARAAEYVHNRYLWSSAGASLMGVLRNVLSESPSEKRAVQAP